IQAAGWADIDLNKLGIDFASAQAAKWLIGPIGAGFIYVNEKLLNETHPKFLGWWSVQDQEDYTYFDREMRLDARKFEVGSPSMISYVGFLKSLETLLAIPNKERESKALGNADYLRKRLDEIGVGFYNFDRTNRSPIVSCTPPNIEDLHKELKEAKIHCSVRNGRLRVSPHFYNDFGNIDRLIEKIG
ncbi:MAG: aminotransferase class V-fold PLP-dependent enzyme, partial [Candidatus Thorarchaeota archaeon]